jgi:hypothetical protein
MTVNPEIARNIRVQLSAVIFRLKVPAATLAEFGVGKRLEVELEANQAPLARLMIGGNLVALAAVSERDGQLVARIIRVNPDPAENPSDQWKLVTEPAE